MGRDKIVGILLGFDGFVPVMVEDATDWSYTGSKKDTKLALKLLNGKNVTILIFGRRSSYGGSSYGNSTNNVPASSSTATASTQTQHSGMSPSPSNSYDTSPLPCTTNQNGRENSDRLSTSNGKMSPSRYHVNSMGQRSYSFEASEEDLDVDDKVEELMRLVCCLFRSPPNSSSF